MFGRHWVFQILRRLLKQVSVRVGLAVFAIRAAGKVFAVNQEIRALVERNTKFSIHAAGGSAEVIIIPDAAHAFDTAEPKKSKKAMTWHCQVTWDPKTMMAYHKREGKEADYSKNDWGNLWDDCSKKRKVTTGGTSAQRKQAEDAIFLFLKNNL